MQPHGACTEFRLQCTHHGLLLALSAVVSGGMQTVRGRTLLLLSLPSHRLRKPLSARATVPADELWSGKDQNTNIVGDIQVFFANFFLGCL